MTVPILIVNMTSHLITLYSSYDLEAYLYGMQSSSCCFMEFVKILKPKM